MSGPAERYPTRPPVDPGLQPERTRLAWSRTALAFAANGVLHMHIGNAQGGGWPWIVPGAVVTASGGVVYWLGRRRFARTDHAVRAGLPVDGSRTVAAAAILALLASLSGVLLALHAS